MATALMTQTFTRSTPVDLYSLAQTLTPLLALANAGSFYVRQQGTSVIVEQASFTNVDLAACQSAVTAAADESERTLSKAVVDQLPLWHKAIFLTLLDQINTLRTSPTTVLSSVTPAQAFAAVKAKADTL